MPDQNFTLVLLDEGARWEGSAKIVAHWTGYEAPSPQVSIPLLMEDKALQIKKEYLAWIHDLGRTKIQGQTVTKILKIFDNLSYWWLTTLAVKSPYDSDSIYSVFKLRTLESVYFDNECSGLIYCGNNALLDKTLKEWCEKLGHCYQRYNVSEKYKRPIKKGVRWWLRKFPGWVQALAHLIKNWYLRYRYINSIKTNDVGPLGKENAVTIVNYFPNFDQEKSKGNQFYSNYWQSLHSVFDEIPVKINWVFFYFDTAGFSFQNAIHFLKGFNDNSSKKHQYFILEEFLTFPVLVKAIKLYFCIYSKGKRLGELRKEFCFSDSQMNFFPFMEKEWKVSLFGNLAMNNAIKIAMFDAMAKTLSASPWGLFIWENQPWDMALISAWKRHQKNTKVFASQHSFFRPFDLRFVSDSRDFFETGGEAMPLPDKLCINNVQGLSLIREAGYPEDRIAKVEAVRYFNLEGKYMTKKQTPERERTLLVIMGVADQENRFLFRLLEDASSRGGLDKYKQVFIKPHPSLSSEGLGLVYESKFSYSIKQQSLSELWELVDVVFGVHSTGAAWEASWNGIPAIVTCAIDSLNLSPLSGLSGVQFVANVDDLLEQLNQPSNAQIPKNYFYLGDNHNLWKALLNV